MEHGNNPRNQLWKPRSGFCSQEPLNRKPRPSVYAVMRKTAWFSLPLLMFVCFSAYAFSKAADPPETQRITHVLNRLAFGPRPGEVERVRQTGVDRYIEEQLYPERIDDREMEARLDAFPTLRLKPADILERYPDQQEVARMLGI